MWYYHTTITNNWREKMAMKPITITLTSQQQVNALYTALEVQYEMENDAARSKDVDEALDRLISTIDLRNQLQNAIDRQHD